MGIAKAVLAHNAFACLSFRAVVNKIVLTRVVSCGVLVFLNAGTEIPFCRRRGQSDRRKRTKRKDRDFGCVSQDSVAPLDAKKANIVDLYLTKYWGMKFATAAACTVLRVDQVGTASLGRAGTEPKPKFDDDA